MQGASLWAIHQTTSWVVAPKTGCHLRHKSLLPMHSEYEFLKRSLLFILYYIRLIYGNSNGIFNVLHRYDPRLLFLILCGRSWDTEDIIPYKAAVTPNTAVKVTNYFFGGFLFQMSCGQFQTFLLLFKGFKVNSIKLQSRRYYKYLPPRHVNRTRVVADIRESYQRIRQKILSCHVWTVFCFRIDETIKRNIYIEREWEISFPSRKLVNSHR